MPEAELLQRFYRNEGYELKMRGSDVSLLPSFLGNCLRVEQILRFLSEAVRAMFLSRASINDEFSLQLGEAYHLHFDSFELSLPVQLYFVLAVCIRYVFTR